MANFFSLKDHPLTGHNLIEASAGTGKTYTISGIFCKFLLQKVDCSKILIVTFTDLAKQELVDRLHNDVYDLYLILTGEKKLAESKPFFTEILTEQNLSSQNEENQKLANYIFEQLSKIDENILTIHGFCNHLAGRFFFEFGFPVQETILEDEQEIFEKTFFKILQKEIYPIFKKDNSLENHSKENSQKINSLLEYIYSFQGGFKGIKEYISHYQKDLEFDMTDEDSQKTEELLPKYNQLKISIKEQLQKEEYWVTDEEETDGYKSDFLLYFCELIKKFGNGNKFRNYQKHLEEIRNFFFDEKDSFFICYCQRKGILEDSNNNRIYNRYNIEYFEENIKKDKQGQEIKFYSDEIETKESELQSKFIVFLKTLNEFFAISEKIEISLRYEYKNILENSLASLRKEISKTKQQFSLKTHDDSLKNVLEAIERKSDFGLKKIRSQYYSVLIDEFQDTDKKQIQIFDKLFLQSSIQKNIFFIGDPKQSIYSFRGADLNSYLSVKKKCNVYTLNQNWRSTKALVNSVNYLYRESINPFLNLEIINPKITAGQQDFSLEKELGCSIEILCNLKDDLKVDPKREKFSIATVNHIVSLINKGINKKEICILVRKKSQAKFVIKELDKLQIDYDWAEDEDLFKTEEASDFFLVLKTIFLKEQQHSISFLSSSLGKIYFQREETFDNLEEVFQYFYNLNHEIVDEVLSKKWVCWKKKINECYKFWKKDNFSKAIDLFFDKEFIVNILISKNGKQIFANIESLIEICRKQLFKKTPNGLINWFGEQLLKSKNASENQYPVQRVETQDTVQIMTIHKSKGLEFDFVYCPFYWDEGKKQKKIYSLDEMYSIPLDEIEKDQAKKKSEELEQQENRRLEYVMFTRAKKKVILGLDDFEDNELKEFKKNIEEVNKEHQSDFGISKLQDFLKNFEIKSNLSFSNSSKKKQIQFLEFPPEQKSYPIISFSSLINQLHDFDNKWQTENFEEENKIFNSPYPKGSLVGTMIHEILEKTNFSNLNSLNELIHHSFEKYYFEQEDFKQFVEEKVNILANKKIINNHSLAEIKNEETLRELEFHLKINHQDLFLAMENQNKIYSQTKQLIKSLKIDSSTQFLNGVIDFIFKFEDRYFIIDWKTNDLSGNYSQENLTKEMTNNFYVLQYHLYSLALDKYLSLHLENYDYQKNFGGVFYIFLRGINNKNQDGIFFDKVPFSFIEKNCK